MSPLLEYQTKLSELESVLSGARAFHWWVLVWLAATALVLAIIAWLALEHRVPEWNAALPMPVAVVLTRRYVINRSERLRLSWLQRFYRRGIERIEGRFAGSGFTGEEFRVPDHPYEADLNLFGSGSLFELLCTTRTEMGRRQLASYLLETPEIAESGARQEAVRELAAQPALREEIALLGRFDFRDSSGEAFSQWLDATGTTTGLPARLLAFVNSLLIASLAFFAYFVSMTHESLLRVASSLAVLVAINAAIAMVYRGRAKAPLEAASRMGMEVGVLREGIALLRRQRFECAKLRAIQEELVRTDAVQLLRRLERMTTTLHDCEKDGLSLFASVLVARTQLWFAIERWRSGYGESLKRWMHAWAEFEALSALAGYAYEHPGDSYPEFVEGETVLDFRDAGHPLLAASLSVRNDFILGADRRFCVISGSNMAGKSTLLRATGLNVVLAYAGAPVRAASLRLSRLSLFASIGVMDSLAEGKSKFLAEMDKLRQMLHSARGGMPVLFLIDEILAGTNSNDRRIASEAVVRGLLRHGAVGALSTHDLSLAEIAEIGELRGTNVHMGSRDGSDPMDFDYLLKPGVIRERNGLAIACLAGVIA